MKDIKSKLKSDTRTESRMDRSKKSFRSKMKEKNSENHPAIKSDILSSPAYTSPTRKATNRQLEEFLEDLPDQGMDDFQQDRQISMCKYLNMMICHTIASNDELKFMKLMTRL